MTDLYFYYLSARVEAAALMVLAGVAALLLDLLRRQRRARIAAENSARNARELLQWTEVAFCCGWLR